MRSEHLEREAAAADHDDAQRLRPAFDRALHREAELVAALGRRQRRDVPAHEDRDHRNAHARGHEVERHHHGMVDGELLRQREVEARLDAGAPQVRGDVGP
jgi:hypothetical protein